MKLGNLLIISLFAALLITAGLLFLPLFPLLPTPAMRSLILAPMYAVFVSVLLQRAGFQGGLFLFSLVIGFVLMIFTPLLLPVSLGAGAIAELVGMGIGRITGHKPWSRSQTARHIASALFPALQFPIMLYGVAAFGGPGGTVLLHPLLVIGLTGAGIILGLAGCRLGNEVIKRITVSKQIEPDSASQRHTGK